MARKALITTLALVVVLGLFVYFTATGRSLLGRVWGESQSADDIAITNKVKSAFSLSKRLSAYEINIEAKDGVVTLTGQVPTDVDKQLAGNVVKDVPDVSRVDNQLQVNPGIKPSESSVREGMRVTDLEIRAELNEKLVSSQGLQGQSIQSNVQDRIVTLTGRVETPAQKTGAEQVARSVANVVDVVNNLEVSNPAAAQNETPGEPEGASKDKELTNRVLFALFKERENFADVGAIKVAGRNGAVTLTGSVASRAERALAQRIADDVDGVKNISNQLTVSTQPK
ncbi:MAG: BON domain-containing protein [Blastocatellales bacterium]